MRWFLVIITLIFIVGCNGSGSAPPPVYYGGNDGLVATIEDIGSISDTGDHNEVWEDQEFALRVELNNRGEYTIPAHEVELKLEGISKDDFQGFTFIQDNDEELEKVSEFLEDGDIEVVDFGKSSYSNLQGIYYDANIWVKYTYPYETYIVIPEVCYKGNIRDKEVCDVDAPKKSYASGGPIQINRVTESYIGRQRIKLTIPIRNAGGGRAKARKSDEFRNEWDEVYFEVNDIDWECESRGDPQIARITKSKGEVDIICTNSNLAEDDLFTRAISLTLKYYYQDRVSETVRIRESPE